MKSFVSVVAVALLFHQVMADLSANQVTVASNTFANKLYEKISKEPGNVLVCPISLHIALGLVLQGAGSNTSTEIASVLGFKSVNSNIKESYKTLLTGITDDTLKIATKLYPAANYQLSSSYVDLAQQYFLSGVEGVDYSKPTEAAQKINKYVEEHTNNKIHDLISPDSISDLTRLVIINAVHFQATWKKTFSMAYDDYFNVSPEEKVLTKMMSMTDYFHYKEDSDLDAKILKMDYTDGGYSMLFILPNKLDGLTALEPKLVNRDLESLLKGLKESKVEVLIPKFKLEKTINLKEVLMNMGINNMFSSRADLRGIANGDNLYVSDVIQKTFINVHENGTEAAAATGVQIELLSASFEPITFTAHWPFHFALVHSERPRTVIFEGRFVRPRGNDLSQESERFQQINDQEGVHYTKGSSEKEKTIVNSEQETEQNSRPNNFNNMVTSSPATNRPHQSNYHKTKIQSTNNVPQPQQATGTTQVYQTQADDYDKFYFAYCTGQSFQPQLTSQYPQSHNSDKQRLCTHIYNIRRYQLSQIPTP